MRLLGELRRVGLKGVFAFAFHVSLICVQLLLLVLTDHLS